MGMYEKYSAWPEWLRWLIFLPSSLLCATAMAWVLRLTAQAEDAFQIVVDLGFPVLWQSIFLGCIFFLVPRGKMGFVWTFFGLRTVFSIGYFAIGIWGLYRGIETSQEWAYWKSGIAELIVFAGSLGVISQLKTDPEGL